MYLEITTANSNLLEKQKFLSMTLKQHKSGQERVNCLNICSKCFLFFFFENNFVSGKARKNLTKL